MRAVEVRVLEAAKACSERWGLDQLTIDDIAHASGVSRATIYRLFPGGKDVLFEALRVHELEEFFADLEREVVDADDARRSARAHGRHRHPAAARRPAPRADARRRAR